MAHHESSKRVLARRWLTDASLHLSAEERAFLEEFARRYPDDPTLTPPERKRLVREFAFLVDRVSEGRVASSPGGGPPVAEPPASR